MDRRALRERIAIERQQAVRDVSLKRDLAGWLDKKLEEIEVCKRKYSYKSKMQLKIQIHRNTKFVLRFAMLGPTRVTPRY